ncbi:IS5 family transposase, partial [Pulveribacter sp.]|uniref:IS5 family transposase n=1 Tax=Pulveribacter sp. TaxID=2678893 RepID=UPI0028AE6F32
ARSLGDGHRVIHGVAGSGWDTPAPDETTILRFRCLLEEHKLALQILALINELLGAKGLMLRAGAIVGATLTVAPSSTKNAAGERDPQMKQSKKGNQWCFGIKAHVGEDAHLGPVHIVRGTAGSVNDIVQANTLLHGEETEAWGDAGYQDADKRPDAKADVRWNIAMRPGKRRKLDKTRLEDDLTDQLERLKASIRAKVEHPFQVIKRQWGHVKVRYRGLAKNTAQLHTLFALSNLWMVRRQLGAVQA